MSFDPNAVFPVYDVAELPTRYSVLLSALIPGAPPNQYVALYPVLESPSPTVLFISTYLPTLSPLLVMPLYEAQFCPSPFVGYVKSISVSGTGGVADFSNQNNSALIAALAA